MAWISVHEQVIGGKLRTLAKELGCSQNEALGMLISLWLWGINNADKSGRIIGAAKEDVAKVLGIGIAKGLDPLKAVDALIRTQWMDLDSDLFIHDWQEWQEQWNRVMDARERDKERKRRERAEKKLAGQNPPPVRKEEPAVGIPQETISIPEEEKSKAATYSNDFEEFWDAYPRKVGKGDAYKKYMTRLRDGWSPAELLEAAANYRTRVLNERTEAQYIKHPKTFLSDTTPFVDFINKRERAAARRNDDDPYAEWRE